MNTNDRMGDWCTAFSGRSYWPLDPNADDIDIIDIAHALSMVCRFNGHVRSFLSVAQHSLLVSKYCLPEHAALGLLHDATEAYIGDVIRPLKKAKIMDSYEYLERRWALTIGRAFGLNGKLAALPQDVHIADVRALVTEARALLPTGTDNWDPHFKVIESFPTVIEPMTPAEAKWAFLQRYNELKNKGLISTREAPDEGSKTPSSRP